MYDDVMSINLVTATVMMFQQRMAYLLNTNANCYSLWPVLFSLRKVLSLRTNLQVLVLVLESQVLVFVFVLESKSMNTTLLRHT